MKLNKLTFINFKGIRNYTLDIQGKDVAIFGDNGTGKTTLADGASWLLFNKDSQNRSDFDIKTLGADGKPLHGLDHEVEGVLDLGDKTLTLRKVYSEIWTKKRGSTTKEFTGHSTDYFLDGVPVKKNEYEAKIASIVDEDAFKLLTNPRYFNEVLHWQERRKILLDVCGDVSDEDVIISNNDLAELPNILEGHTLEDFRKIIQSKRTSINQELMKVPIRISEVERGLPSPGDIISITASLASLKVDRNKKSEALANLEAGGSVAEETKKLREVEAEMIKVEKEYWLTTANTTQSAKVELRGLQDKASELESTIKNKQRWVANAFELITSNEKLMEQLRQEWQEQNDIEFTFEKFDVCPTCKQSLPAEQVTAARDKALADFNLAKAQRLESINAKGKIIKDRTTSEKNESSATEGQIVEAERKLAEFNGKIADAQAKIESLEKQEKDYTNDPAYIELQQKKEATETTILGLKDGFATNAEKIKQAIRAIDLEIADCERILAQIEQRTSGLKRIDELKNQERQLAKDFEDLESQTYLIEQFTRARVKLLEDKLDNKFSVVRFKMFSELINGALEDTCITLIDGVPYSDLNHGGKMAAGLDIITTLQKQYGFAAPIWIDNSEAFCHLPEMCTQVIKLIVSADDPALRVVTA